MAPVKIYLERIADCREDWGPTHWSCPRFMHSMSPEPFYEIHCDCSCHGEPRLRPVYGMGEKVEGVDFVVVGKP